MRLFNSAYRPVRQIPRQVIILLVLAILTQLSWHQWAVTSHAQAQALPAASKIQWVRIMSLGESEVAAKLLMLWLQAFDNQPGLSLPLDSFDYEKIENWLQLISDLDNRSHYSLFSAAYIYAVVGNKEKQKQVFRFLERSFLIQPNKRWRWLAHAAIMAQHRLKDNELALRYALLLRQYATGPGVPSWVRQLEIGILEAQGEYASAQLLIGGLLQEEKITDPHERAFLNTRLQQLKQTAAKGSVQPFGPIRLE